MTASTIRRAMAPGMLAFTVLAPTPATVSAAAPYYFDTTLGETCTSGSGPEGEELTVRLRSAAGKLLGVDTVTVNPFDTFDACFDTPIRAGYKLIAKGPQGTSSFIVPGLKVRLDRVTNEVSGTAPDGAFLYIYVYDCTPFTCTIDKQPTTTADGTGAWSVDPLTDIDGYDWAIVLHRTDADHNVRREGRAPWFEVRRAGKNAVTFHADNGGHVTFTLRSSGGTVLDTVHKDIPKAGAYVLRFRSSGHPVNISAGRRVSGSFASDTAMDIPSLALAFDVAADEVSGRCFANQAWRLSGHAPDAGPGDFQIDAGVADGSGAFVGNVTGLADGWTVVVTCENQHGDWLVLRGEA